MGLLWSGACDQSPGLIKLTLAVDAQEISPNLAAWNTTIFGFLHVLNTKNVTCGCGRSGVV